MTESDVIVYMRHILLEVTIPEEFVWEFMKEYGCTFALEDLMEGGTRVVTVQNYYNHPNGWHVEVKVWENDEQKFYNFLKNFCGERGLTFRDPHLEKKRVS
jgi:hypothetical protein